MSRIYLVTRDGGNHRLIRASNQAQAIGYCARADYAATVATQEQLVGLRHLEVENAGEPAATIEPPERSGPRIISSANPLSSDAE